MQIVKLIFHDSLLQKPKTLHVCKIVNLKHES